MSEPARTVIEARLSALEAEVRRLCGVVAQLHPKAPEPWWRAIAGTFADDPAFDEAMRLGRKYRESLRPKPRRKSKRGR
jgi:hypothetical protein